MIDKVQKIRDEVEMVVNRRLNLLNGDYFNLIEETDGFTNEIMDIIDSMQEEPVSKDYRERYKKIAQSDAFKSAYQNKSLGEVMSVKGKEPVSEDLEEVISYLSKRYPEVSFAKLSRIAVYVAKWQKEKEYTCYEEAFEDGAKWEKEQMMKEAFDGEVGYWNLRGLSVNVELPHSVEEGDKVKVIVIKED